MLYSSLRMKRKWEYPHLGVVLSITKMGIRVILVNWLKDYIAGRNQKVVLNGVDSKKQLSMTRKYRNHTMQTNPRHNEEEPQNNNNHKILGRQRMSSK